MPSSFQGTPLVSAATVNLEESSSLSVAGTSTQHCLNPEKLLCWGELQLLHALQQRFIDEFNECSGGGRGSSSSSLESRINPAMTSHSQMIFNPRRSHADIVISGDGKTVTHRNSKLWASVSTVNGFPPHSGRSHSYVQSTHSLTHCSHTLVHTISTYSLTYYIHTLYHTLSTHPLTPSNTPSTPSNTSS